MRPTPSMTHNRAAVIYKPLEPFGVVPSTQELAQTSMPYFVRFKARSCSALDHHDTAKKS
eukprot:3276202-Amphidinium_carterae.1